MATSLTLSRILSLTIVTTSFFAPKTLPSKLSLKLSNHRHPIFSSSTTIFIVITVDKLLEATFSYLDSANEMKIMMVSKVTKWGRRWCCLSSATCSPLCAPKSTCWNSWRN
ncbi:hypothetical protein E2542_SST01326 [Spatholobus suberectus]|nr:hypothetical protein E2542_SST01326 [Spatholobus suberectus]